MNVDDEKLWMAEEIPRRMDRVYSARIGRMDVVPITSSPLCSGGTLEPPANPFGDVIEGLGRVSMREVLLRTGVIQQWMACERSIREALLVKKKKGMDEMIESGQSEFTAALRELQREQRAKAKERLLDELRERLETALTAIGEDIYAEHDVLRFSREYGCAHAGIYTYATIKCDGRWYLTGRYGERWPNGITWDELREFVSAGLVEYPDGTTLPQLLTAGREDHMNEKESELCSRCGDPITNTNASDKASDDLCQDCRHEKDSMNNSTD